MNKPQPYIHPEAKIGKGTIVESFSFIYDDVTIGENTWIGPNVTIFPGTRIGSNCKVFPGAVLGAKPQDLKFDEEYTTVEIGDDTTIRECVTINRATNDKKVTRVGKGCLLMAYCHVAHDTWVGDYCVLANQVALAGHVEIEDFVVLEGTVAVQQFVKIGRHTFIAGGSLVRKNVPPYIKAAREPICYVGINSVGMKRRNFSVENIRLIEDIYRIIYVQNQNLSKGLEQVRIEISSSELREEILNFIEKSSRGVIRGIFE